MNQSIPEQTSSDDFKRISNIGFEGIRACGSDDDDVFVKPFIELEDEKEFSIYDLKKLHFSEPLMNMMFCIVFASLLVTSMDHGAVPAASQSLQKDLNLSHKDFGFFGSLVFVGIIFGAAIGTCIMDQVRYKLLLSATLAVNAVGLLIFAFC